MKSSENSCEKFIRRYEWRKEQRKKGSCRGILHFSQICLIIFLIGHQMQRITHYKPSLARVSFFKITEPLMSALPSNRGRRMLTSSSVMV